MKLRTYKNLTDYNHSKPWLYPATKDFSPKKQWSIRKGDTNLINAEYKKKFTDKFAQKNHNEMAHQFDKNGIIQTAMWQCSLRDLKPPPSKKATGENSPSKGEKKKQ